VRRDDTVEARDAAGKRRQCLGERCRRDQEARTGILGDEFDLARRQPRVRRHRTQPGRPAAEHQLEELTAIFER
jgi:hypothetical protein